jgi:hypothetical protein
MSEELVELQGICCEDRTKKLTNSLKPVPHCLLIGDTDHYTMKVWVSHSNLLPWSPRSPDLSPIEPVQKTTFERVH